MNVYAFFEPIDENWIDHKDYKKILELWKKSWTFYGWNPVIYGIKECEKHPQFDLIYKLCEKFPTVNPKKYEMFCYLRWLYMANVGGWYSDIDMINYGFTPKDYQNKIVSSGIALHCCPIFMNTNNYQKLIDTYFNINENSFISIHNKPHYSDMYILKNFSDNIDIKLNILKEYPYYGHDVSLITHYPSNCMFSEKENTTRTQIILKDKRTAEFL